MIHNVRNSLFTSLFLTLIICNVNAQDSKPYRPNHNETCFEIPGYKIACGDFKLASTLLAKKYDSASAGKDVLASFSVETHPGDHPFLNRLAKKLGYIDSDQKSLTNNSVFTWKNLNSETKRTIVEKFSNIETTPEIKALLPNYLNNCIDYWTDPSAKYDERTELPTLAEVSALCVADSGILPQQSK